LKRTPPLPRFFVKLLDFGEVGFPGDALVSMTGLQESDLRRYKDDRLYFGFGTLCFVVCGLRYAKIGSRKICFSDGNTDTKRRTRYDAGAKKSTGMNKPGLDRFTTNK